MVVLIANAMEGCSHHRSCTVEYLSSRVRGQLGLISSTSFHTEYYCRYVKLMDLDRNGMCLQNPVPELLSFLQC